MVNEVFEYKTEKELQDYIINNFSKFFPFSYKCREECRGGKFIDIVGEDDVFNYLIETKRFIATPETVKQLEFYLDHYYSAKQLRGIILAPELHGLDVAKTYGKNDNIEILCPTNIRCTANPINKSYQKSFKYGTRRSMYVSPQYANMLQELTDNITLLKLTELAVARLTDIPQSVLLRKIKESKTRGKVSVALTISTATSANIDNYVSEGATKRQVLEMAILFLYESRYKGFLINCINNNWYVQEAFGNWRTSKYSYKTQKAVIRAIDKGTLRF